MSKDKKPLSLRVEILEKMTTLIAASFGFVAAFAWNESFKLLIDRLFDEDAELIAFFIYAVVITFVAVMVIIMISRATAKAKARLEK